MSSDVITQAHWNSLHVARRVRDIAKSMTRLSRLGRSIFPMTSHRGRGVEEPAVGLKVSEPPQSLIRGPPRATSDDCASARHRCYLCISRSGLGLPALPSSPRSAGARLGTCPGGGRHGGGTGPGVVGGAKIVLGTDPRPPPGGRRESAGAGTGTRGNVGHPPRPPPQPRPKIFPRSAVAR